MNGMARRLLLIQATAVAACGQVPTSTSSEQGVVQEVADHLSSVQFWDEATPEVSLYRVGLRDHVAMVVTERTLRVCSEKLGSVFEFGRSSSGRLILLSVQKRSDQKLPITQLCWSFRGELSGGVSSSTGIAGRGIERLLNESAGGAPPAPPKVGEGRLMDLPELVWPASELNSATDLEREKSLAFAIREHLNVINDYRQGTCASSAVVARSARFEPFVYALARYHDCSAAVLMFERSEDSEDRTWMLAARYDREEKIQFYLPRIMGRRGVEISVPAPPAPDLSNPKSERPAKRTLPRD